MPPGDPHSIPVFGGADLSNCEREPIHLAGSVQPHGALLALREADATVLQCSANAPALLGVDGELGGRRATQLPGDIAARVAAHRHEDLSSLPVALRCRVGEPDHVLDGLLHRSPDGALVLELEHPGALEPPPEGIEQSIQAVLASSSLRGLCDEAARHFKTLTGYDRAMVYRFDDAGHGQVFSEAAEPGLEPYLGNWYPSTDIPQMARQLYRRNRVRVLVDVDYTPVPLVPVRSPDTGAELDMSLSYLRSMSPIHLQYLRNMGVSATLVMSLVVGDQLWGLVACHHYAPRRIGYRLRALCEVLAETVATRIAALESFTRVQAELSVRRLEQRMAEAVAREGDWRIALLDEPRSLLQPVNATGAALLLEDQVLSVGEVPGTQWLRQLAGWLDRQPPGSVRSADALALQVPEFEPLRNVACGLLAVPVSSGAGEYLLWFRPERVRTVTWGGNPFEAVLQGETPEDLSPRRSFAKWHQEVEGTAEPWNHNELAVAQLIGESVADMVQQFRAVRMLIARHQLDVVTQQVHLSQQPLVIADASGRILLINATGEASLAGDTRQPRWLEDLAESFEEAPRVREQLRNLLETGEPWRGEVRAAQAEGRDRPLLVRADPVFSDPDHVLGYVLLFTDISQRREAEAARRRLHDEIAGRNRIVNLQLDPGARLAYRELLATVMQNAQLAALEITDGVDPARMSEMLDSVQASLTRTAALLERLLRHADGGGGPDERGS